MSRRRLARPLVAVAAAAAVLAGTVAVLQAGDEGAIDTGLTDQLDQPMAAVLDPVPEGYTVAADDYTDWFRWFRILTLSGGDGQVDAAISVYESAIVPGEGVWADVGLTEEADPEGTRTLEVGDVTVRYLEAEVGSEEPAGAWWTVVDDEGRQHRYGVQAHGDHLGIDQLLAVVEELVADPRRATPDGWRLQPGGDLVDGVAEGALLYLPDEGGRRLQTRVLDGDLDELAAFGLAMGRLQGDVVEVSETTVDGRRGLVIDGVDDATSLAWEVDGLLVVLSGPDLDQLRSLTPRLRLLPFAEAESQIEGTQPPGD